MRYKDVMIVWGGLALLALSGCSGGGDEAECNGDFDCPGDRICRQSECVLPESMDMGGGTPTPEDMGTAPTCSDGVQNGDEAGVDCGGSSCQACMTSVEPTCFDGVRNGSEQGVDCGGSCVSDCEAGPTCFDGVQNGDEQGADCGGSCASSCQSASCSGTLRCEDTRGVCGQIQGCEVESSGTCRSNEKSADYCDRYGDETSCDNDVFYCFWDDETSRCEDSCKLPAFGGMESSCTEDIGCRWIRTSACTGSPTISCDDLTDASLCEQAGCTFE